MCVCSCICVTDEEVRYRAADTTCLRALQLAAHHQDSEDAVDRLNNEGNHNKNKAGTVLVHCLELPIRGLVLAHTIVVHAGNTRPAHKKSGSAQDGQDNGKHKRRAGTEDHHHTVDDQDQREHNRGDREHGGAHHVVLSLRAPKGLLATTDVFGAPTVSLVSEQCKAGAGIIIPRLKLLNRCPDHGEGQYDHLQNSEDDRPKVTK